MPIGKDAIRGTIIQFSRTMEISQESDTKHYQQYFKLWEPQEGEWVFIESMDNTASLQQWSKELEEALTTKWNIFGLRYEPFTGKLPTFLKEMPNEELN